MTRRDSLKAALAAGFFAMSEELALPALAEDGVDIPFTDIPANYNPANPAAATRQLDIRSIDGPFTPKEKFFAMQHYAKPEINGDTYRLKISGLVNKRSEEHTSELQ